MYYVYPATQGDLTQIFPTFSNPILNLNFYINADPKSTYVSNIQQNCIELCTNIIFCHHFIITLIYMAKFRSKNIFYISNIEDGQKVLWKSNALILNCIFYEKKSFAKLLRFLRFSQIQLPGGKIWDWYTGNFSEFFWFFDTYVELRSALI